MKHRKTGFLRRLVLTYSAFLLVFMLVLVGAAYQYVVSVSEKTAAINQTQLLDKMVSQVDAYLSEMDQMAQQVKSDPRIINIFNRLQQDASRENYFDVNIMDSIDIASVLTSHNGPSMPIWRISVYNQHGDFISAGASVNPESRVSETLYETDVGAQMRELIDGRAGYLLLPPQEDRWSGTYKARYTSLLRPITNFSSKEVYGIVEIQQGVDQLESYLALDVLTDTVVFLFDGEGNQILPAGRAYSDLDERDYYVTAKLSDQYGWRVALAQDRRSMMQPYRSMTVYLFIGSLVTIILLILAVYLISKRISAPLIRLSDEVRKISIDSIQADLVPDESIDEVRELNAAFQSMLKKMNDSVACEQKAYLLALQSQMNPHFLYNSLSTISSMAIEAGEDRIADTCERISQMLRYSSSYSSGGATLGSEIENVRNYLELMKLRYEEYFDYDLSLDERLEGMAIPRLIIQPIVENCFEHAFKQVEPPWRVSITSRIEGDRWCISVADNGSGFADGEIDELERKVAQYSEDLPANYSELKIGGLGLVNTIIRLKLSAGESVGYRIARNFPQGTTVTLSGRWSAK